MLNLFYLNSKNATVQLSYINSLKILACTTIGYEFLKATVS